MKSNDLISRLYDQDEQSGAYVIRVGVHQYSDLFNDLDPSPLRRRDLDSDFVAYLDDCSDDIPLKYPLRINIDLPAVSQSQDQEAKVRSGITAYYGFVLLLLKKERMQIFRKSIQYVITAIALILISYTLNESITASIWSNTLVEGFSIGGWVFLWEAFNLAVFKNLSIKKRMKKVRRLDRAPIAFTYLTL